MPENIYMLKIFHGIEREIIEQIIENCDSRNYNKDEMIIIEGEESNGEGYILKKGSVSISIGGTHIAELSTGDIFGEIALLNEEERTATVVANSDIEVIVLRLDDIVQMMQANYQINKTVIQRIEENLER